MVQAIIDRNRKTAKAEEDKATVIGGVIGMGAFQLIAMFGLHLQSGHGFDLYRTAGAVACGLAGAGIGKWVGRPRGSRK
jgi:outer membrane lipoprotein SlyB